MCGWNRRSREDLDRIKAMDMVAYLASLGFEPAKISRQDYWYLSPWRDERTASFKINRQLNRWYDFGEGVGGSIIDFGIRYHACPITEFIELISESSIKFEPYQPSTSLHNVRHSKVEITHVNPISSKILVHYLASRGINLEIAAQYLNEVSYTNAGKHFYALGFQNSKGGYELRSPFFKGSSAPKYFSFHSTGLQTVSIFEGFMDFLSFLVLDRETTKNPKTDYLILNSLSFIQPAIQMAKAYKEVSLFLDNDAQGDKMTALMLKQVPHAVDGRKQYIARKDWNDYLCSIRPRQNRKLGL
ncbi:MAG: hypothetical protein BGO31_12635 [Bacteroidetes bacterium 43-16]|nr:MAG: hypothetical protein BGO31_12635 [Bacteroidetes bacterium 43-16]